jgi:hypothetical protein
VVTRKFPTGSPETEKLCETVKSPVLKLKVSLKFITIVKVIAKSIASCIDIFDSAFLAVAVPKLFLESNAALATSIALASSNTTALAGKVGVGKPVSPPPPPPQPVISKIEAVITVADGIRNDLIIDIENLPIFINLSRIRGGRFKGYRFTPDCSDYCELISIRSLFFGPDKWSNGGK